MAIITLSKWIPINTNELKKGDIVIGNKNASKKYPEAFKGVIAIVLQPTNPMIIRGFINSCDYWVEKDCFDKIADAENADKFLSVYNTKFEKQMKQYANKIKKNKKVKSVKVEGCKIIIETIPLFGELNDTEYSIGRAKIIIDQNCRIKAISMDTLKHINPHCSDSGYICFGNLNSIIYNMKMTGNIQYDVLASLTIRFLEKAWNYDFATNVSYDIKNWVKKEMQNV